MRIWIDIVNSAHVLFFKPIMDDLKNEGHLIYVTAREYAQTTGLLNEFNVSYTLIGRHAGPHVGKKILDVIGRAYQLRSYAQDKSFDLALTFNSPSLVLASKLLHIRSMVFMDYEFQPLNHLTFRLADRVVTPYVFPEKSLIRHGGLNKNIKFDGLKEQVYLSDFEPDPYFLQSLGIDNSQVIVAARPPATMALYHRFENTLFYEVLYYLARQKNTTVIVFPRSEAQRIELKTMEDMKLIIPETALDGRNLLYHSDIVISAGGTMNREAAVLGTPAYTLFKGQIGAVDRYLIDSGRIVQIRDSADFKLIKVEKKKRADMLRKPGLKRDIVNIICENGVPLESDR